MDFENYHEVRVVKRLDRRKVVVSFAPPVARYENSETPTKVDLSLWLVKRNGISIGKTGKLYRAMEVVISSKPF